jgi:hypothetical protein
MAEESSTEQVLRRLFEQVSEHIETRWAYLTVTATEKISGMASDLIGAFTTFIFAVLMLFFFSLGLAWWLGDFINSRPGGFALTGLIFIPIGYFANRWIRPYVRERVIKSALEEDETENPNNNG